MGLSPSLRFKDSATVFSFSPRVRGWWVCLTGLEGDDRGLSVGLLPVHLSYLYWLSSLRSGYAYCVYGAFSYPHDTTVIEGILELWWGQCPAYPGPVRRWLEGPWGQEGLPV